MSGFHGNQTKSHDEFLGNRLIGQRREAGTGRMKGTSVVIDVQRSSFASVRQALALRARDCGADPRNLHPVLAVVLVQWRQFQRSL